MPYCDFSFPKDHTQTVQFLGYILMEESEHLFQWIFTSPLEVSAKNYQQHRET